MSLSTERDSILLEYEEMKGSLEELSQRYEELRNKQGGGGGGGGVVTTPDSSFNNNVRKININISI